MSDKAPDDDQAWWTPADRPDPVDQDVLTALAGRIDPTRPIGPLGLRARSWRPNLLVAVAVAALLGGAGAALVVTDSGRPVPAHNAAAAGPAPAASAVPTSPSSGGSSQGPVAPGISGAVPGVLHGQFVSRKPGGGYQVVDVQIGQVTAVSSTSITLRSEDGFTRSYVVAAGTVVDAGRAGIGSVKVGDQAAVDATVTASPAAGPAGSAAGPGAPTASRIDDLTLLRQRGSALSHWRGPSGGPGAAAR
jgi:hypothetical protein